MAFPPRMPQLPFPRPSPQGTPDGPTLSQPVPPVQPQRQSRGAPQEPGAALVGADPVGKGKFNNSMGLMVDPGSKLVWAVGQNGHLFVLRFDAKQAKLHPLP